MKTRRMIQEQEKITKHDVKAIEYFLREKLNACHSDELHSSNQESQTNKKKTLRQRTAQSDIISFIHFGLTSEDTNSIAQAIALRELA